MSWVRCRKSQRQIGSYRYDALGRRVQKTFAYQDGFGSHSGNITYVYGTDGGILAEYKYESTPFGRDDTITDNVTLNGRVVARAITLLSHQNQIAIECLRRNHLGEVLAKDEWNLDLGFPTTTTATTYSQPFSSGGSDQFPGVKADPEGGLTDFGTRYYHPIMSRWTSPDSVMAHQYDPQSLNKYTYVRNDPVNLVDPNGRDWDGGIWYGPPPETITPGGNGYGRPGTEEYADGGGGGGGSSPDDWINATVFAARWTADKMLAKADCYNFLIKDLFGGFQSNQDAEITYFRLRNQLGTSGIDPTVSVVPFVSHVTTAGPNGAAATANTNQCICK